MTLSQNTGFARAVREQRGEPAPLGDPLKLPYYRVLEEVQSLRPSEAFRRFVRMGACALALGEQEALYLDTVRGLEPRDHDVLVRAFAQLVEDMEARPFRDLLGPVYMEIGHRLDKKSGGEFFTPHEVSRLLAEMALGADPRATFPEGRPLDVLEPAGGTGSMLLAFVHVLAEHGVAARHARVTTWDISATSSYGAFINLTLYGVPATVVCGDTLRQDVHWAWRNPFWNAAAPLAHEPSSPPPEFEARMKAALDVLFRTLSPRPAPRPEEAPMTATNIAEVQTPTPAPAPEPGVLINVGRFVEFAPDRAAPDTRITGVVSSVGPAGFVVWSTAAPSNTGGHRRQAEELTPTAIEPIGGYREGDRVVFAKPTNFPGEHRVVGGGGNSLEVEILIVTDGSSGHANVGRAALRLCVRSDLESAKFALTGQVAEEPEPVVPVTPKKGKGKQAKAAPTPVQTAESAAEAASSAAPAFEKGAGVLVTSPALGSTFFARIEGGPDESGRYAVTREWTLDRHVVDAAALAAAPDGADREYKVGDRVTTQAHGAWVPGTITRLPDRTTDTYVVELDTDRSLIVRVAFELAPLISVVDEDATSPEVAEPTPSAEPAPTSKKGKKKAARAPSPAAPEAAAPPAPVAAASTITAAQRTLVPLSALRRSPLNPRKAFDHDALVELAANIHAKGLLQNLVVRPGPDGTYEIAAGERRFRALQILVEGLDVGGETVRLPADHPVPVIVQPLTDRELLELATAENVQRRRMTPMEEADAFAAIADHGATIPEIARRFGYTERTVARRLDIARNLGDDAKKAFDEGRITLAIAEVIAIAPKAAQKNILTDARYYSASQLRERLTQGAFLVKHRLFPEGQYKGAVVEDLFGDFEPYFQDKKQALELQLAHLEILAEQDRANGAEFAIVVVDPYSGHEWKYPAREGATGVLYWMRSSTGEVQRSAGRSKRDEAPTPAAPTGPTMDWNAQLVVRAAQERALSRAILADAKLALAWQGMDLLCERDAFGDRTEWLNDEPDLLDFAARLDELTGGVVRPFGPGEGNGWLTVGTPDAAPSEDEADADRYNPDEVLAALLKLDEADLRRLVQIGAALDTSFAGNERTGLARVVGASLAGTFVLTKKFLDGLNRPALDRVLEEAGFAPDDFEGDADALVRTRLFEDAAALRDKGFVPSFVQFAGKETA